MSKITAINLDREYIVIDGMYLYVLIDNKWTLSDLPTVGIEPSKKWSSEKFETFWKKYPKSYGKQEAQKVWKSSNCDANYDNIMKGLDVWMNSKNWDNKIYVTNCAKWLRNKMFLEQPEHNEVFVLENNTNYRKKFLDKIENKSIVTDNET